MSVYRFEDLRVWRAAKAFSDSVGVLIMRPEISKDFALRNQLNAAALSVLANIAEGFQRGHRKEFARFVRIASSSNAEARALLHAARGRSYLGDQEFQRLVEMTNSIGKMLRMLELRLRS